MTEHEVIVVGAGPAGTAAAWELVRRGVDCLLLDQASFPREKLCAGWITPQVLADLEFQPGDYPYRFLTFEALQISIKGLHFPFRSAQHSIRRFEFDQWLLERSAAPFQQHRVRRIERVGDGFQLDGQFSARYLIGAGGTRCPVYRELFKPDAPRERALQVVTQELEFPFNVPSADCHLWFFAGGLPGYSWYVPKQNGYLNVGIGAVAGRLKASGGDIRDHWQLLIDELIRVRLLDADPGQPDGYSYFLRARAAVPSIANASVRNTSVRNAFVVGDSLGLATRDMCEGIGPAVQSGLMAARTILGDVSFDLNRIPAHTLGQPLARRALDFAITRNA